MKRKGGKRVAEGNNTKVSSHSGGGGGVGGRSKFDLKCFRNGVAWTDSHPRMLRPPSDALCAQFEVAGEFRADTEWVGAVRTCYSCDCCFSPLLSFLL